MRLVKHFISVYGQAGNTLILDGMPTDADLRQEITDFLRLQSAQMELHYWEHSLEELAAEMPERKKGLTRAHAAYEHPHPWEFHKVNYMTE